MCDYIGFDFLYVRLDITILGIWHLNIKILLITKDFCFKTRTSERDVFIKMIIEWIGYDLEE